MMDSRITKHAKILINYSLKLQRGETLLISAEPSALPLVKECFRLALAVGGHPKISLNDPEITELLYNNGSDEQLQFVHSIDMAIVEGFDAMLTLLGTNNTRALAGVNPKKIRIVNQGRKELATIRANRTAASEFRWCGTQFPTFANAQEANMSLSDYQKFVYRSCKVDQDDPVIAWQKLEAQQELLCNYLNGCKKLQITSKDTNLSMLITGRKWVNCHGLVNLPDGEIFTGPIENSVNGHIRFSFPGIFSGHEIEDICLTFKDGKVIEATASKGEEILHDILDTDAGARSVGEIAIGTNNGIDCFTKSMLFDEKTGGTVHLALGKSLHPSGGLNKSVIHWDMLCDMRDGGQIFADDKLIYQNGEFCI